MAAIGGARRRRDRVAHTAPALAPPHSLRSSLDVVNRDRFINRLTQFRTTIKDLAITPA